MLSRKPAVARDDPEKHVVLVPCWKSACDQDIASEEVFEDLL